MNTKELAEVLLALMYISGDPIDIKDIMKTYEISQLELQAALDEISSRFSEDSGILFLQFGNKIQLATNHKYFDKLEMLINPVQKKSLSQVALEVLSIVAYKQPVTRGELEEIRGVKCDYSVISLLEKGLIKQVGRKDTLGKPILYGTTDLFLRTFGLKSLSDLPEQDLSQLQKPEDSNTSE